MKIRKIFLALIAVTLLFIPSNSPTQTLGCNSDSLRVLARVYPSRFINDQLLQEQAECFNYNRNTALDTVLHMYGKNWMRRGFLVIMIDSILARPGNDSTTIADLYYFKACTILEAVHELEFSDTLKGLEYLDSTLAYNKNYHLAWYNKGVLYLVLKDLDRAIECFRKAIEIENKHIHYWLYYGVSLYHNGAEIQSKKALDSAVQKSSRNFVCFKFLGDELKSFGLFSEAIRIYDSALFIRQDDPDVWFNYATSIYELDSTKEIGDYLDSTLNYCEDDGELLTFFIYASSMGYREKSQEFIDKALFINRENFWGWLYKSGNLFEMGDTSSAVACLDSALKYETSNLFMDHDFFRGGQLLAFGLYEEALSNLESVDLKNLDSTLVKGYYLYRAACYDRLGKLDRASVLCDSLLELFPNDSGAVSFCDSIKTKLEK